MCVFGAMRMGRLRPHIVDPFNIHVLSFEISEIYITIIQPDLYNQSGKKNIGGSEFMMMFRSHLIGCFIISCTDHNIRLIRRLEARKTYFLEASC